MKKCTTLLFFALCCAAHPVYADHHLYRPPFALVETLKGELDLNEEQETALRAVMSDVEAFKNEQRRDARRRLAELMKKSGVSAAEVEAALPDHEARRAAMRGFVAAKIAEFHALLTPAQRLTLSEKLPEMSEQWMRERRARKYDEGGGEQRMSPRPRGPRGTAE